MATIRAWKTGFLAHAADGVEVQMTLAEEALSMARWTSWSLRSSMSMGRRHEQMYCDSASCLPNALKSSCCVTLASFISRIMHSSSTISGRESPHLSPNCTLLSSSSILIMSVTCLLSPSRSQKLATLANATLELPPFVFELESLSIMDWVPPDWDPLLFLLSTLLTSSTLPARMLSQASTLTTLSLKRASPFIEAWEGGGRRKTSFDLCECGVPDFASA
mmetsp:Transcript_40723/g.94482  ORF Transcript_40723/g.94482 Transcript_40723/m.94482 type:complete len:220 (-) Transcript_40723:30-689(-)